MNDMKPVISNTDDGSNSLFNGLLNEFYHSKFGAMTESNHIFIRNGLFCISKVSEEVRILEVGFGTGLNALLTLKETNTIQKVKYTAIELYPIDIETSKSLNFCNFPNLESFRTHFNTLHESRWGMETSITVDFSLNKIQVDLTAFEPVPDSFELIYFDAFSPNVQPELWSEAIFKRLYNSLSMNGILVTYCAKGVVKQALRKVGFVVKRLPGPPGKRHMIQALKMTD
jgi:tRNA U34 5-methylaminomethyl-2-thiouridine-forming methyltransferase MnmC